jgi:(methylthio)acryloyl-CoA hydratase
MHVLPRIADSNPEQGLMMESLIATITKNTPEAKERLRLFLDGKAKKIGE